MSDPAPDTPNPLVAVFEAKGISILGTVKDPLFRACSVAKYVGDAHYRRTLQGYQKVATETTGPYVHIIGALDAKGREQPTMYLTENGLYRYLLRSDSSKAIEFQLYVYELLKQERERVVDSARLALKIAESQKEEYKLGQRMTKSELIEAMAAANSARAGEAKAQAALRKLQKKIDAETDERIAAIEEANRTRGCFQTLRPI